MVVVQDPWTPEGHYISVSTLDCIAHSGSEIGCFGASPRLFERKGTAT